MSKLVNCYKCSGAGKIEAFSGIANGDCFACGATGKMDAADVPAEEKVGEVEQSKIDWIAAASDDVWASFTWEQINKARRFALWFASKGCVWPDAAESRFQNLQTIKRESLTRFAL